MFTLVSFIVIIHHSCVLFVVIVVVCGSCDSVIVVVFVAALKAKHCILKANVFKVNVLSLLLLLQ